MMGSFLLLAGLLSLSPIEEREVNERLEAFYASSHPSTMQVRPPKFALNSGEFIEPNSFLKLPDAPPSHSLDHLAQVKGTEKFQRYYCENFLKKHFPGFSCDSTADSSVQEHDRVEDLTYEWVADPIRYIEELPSEGMADSMGWSDDYWRMRWGITSYRYGLYKGTPPFANYKHAINSYAQPNDWLNLGSLLPAEKSVKIQKWSPSEKYDLTVGDDKFTLTNQQKSEGFSNLTQGTEDVEGWMGICHGWAPASIMAQKPKSPTQVTGLQGTPVDWYPSDVKAMLSLAWANGDFQNYFVGRRCAGKKPETYPNGRIKNQECFDNNPATFHVALGNLLGMKNKSFIIDKSLDYQVWNQPLYAYEFTYFNPLNPAHRSKQWQTVAVPYDSQFKSRDRFQHPLTRGDAIQHGYSDTKIKKVVGVMTTVLYLFEVVPLHGPVEQGDQLVRETYTYDLELEEENGHFKITGGEWHTNSHPDFLWMPGKTAAPFQETDTLVTSYVGNEVPPVALTQASQKASRKGYPLCRVVKELLYKSSGVDSLLCK